MTIVIYFDEYLPAERETLSSAGVTALAASSAHLDALSQHLHNFRGRDVLCRGPKVHPDRYAEIARDLAALGLRPGTPAGSYRALYYPGIHEAELEGLLPSSVSVGIASNPQDVIAALPIDASYPLFFKTELGSLLKFGDFKDCLLREPSVDEVQRITALVRRFLPKAETLVFKPILEFESDETGKPLEVRFISLSSRSSLVVDRGDPGPDRTLHDFTDDVITRLRSRGIVGDMFIDVSRLLGGRPSVVEIKSLLNGTIQSPLQLFEFPTSA